MQGFRASVVYIGFVALGEPQPHLGPPGPSARNIGFRSRMYPSKSQVERGLPVSNLVVILRALFAFLTAKPFGRPAIIRVSVSVCLCLFCALFALIAQLMQ